MIEFSALRADLPTSSLCSNPSPISAFSAPPSQVTRHMCNTKRISEIFGELLRFCPSCASPVCSGKSIRHEDLLAIQGPGEAEWLRVGLVGDESSRLGPLPAPKNTAPFRFWLSQQNTNRRTGADWFQEGTGGAGTHYLRPPEPAAQQRGDGRRHERTHDQGVE